MPVQRMDHVGVVVRDIERAIEFFTLLGLERTGEGTVEGDWVDRVVGLDTIRSKLAFLRTPDGNTQIELAQFLTPASPAGDPHPAPNAPGLRHLTFEVDSLDATLDALEPWGVELVGTIERYGDVFRLCYARGPEGIIVELAERPQD